MAKKRIPLSEQIRVAIRESGFSRYAICKAIDIGQPSMTRFMNGQAGLSLETLDRIAELIDLNITAGKGSQAKKG